MYVQCIGHYSVYTVKIKRRPVGSERIVLKIGYKIFGKSGSLFIKNSSVRRDLCRVNCLVFFSFGIFVFYLVSQNHSNVTWFLKKMKILAELEAGCSNVHVEF